ncbi:hypothetical protein AB1Y20_009552 [Prymnesium parvum]|uniref:Protein DETOXIFICATION n=1 Tax=Prymnesium parvum TaxID=97485 RepID=A0AB34K4I4_PRYPA
MAFHAPPITGSPPPPVVPSPPQCATPVSAQSSQPPNRLGFDISAPELALTKDASFVPLHSSIESCSSSPASSVYVPAPLPEIPELGLIGPVASFDLPRSEEATVAESGSNLIVQLAPPESEVAMPTLRELAAFCLPSLGIWLSSPCLSLIDTSVVGMQCATSQLAALGPSTKLCDYVAFFCTVLSAATTNLAAAAFAQNDSPSAKHIIASSLTISLAVGGALAAIIRFVALPAMSAMLNSAGGPAVLTAATAYTKIRALGYPAALLTMVLQAAFVAAKDARTPLLAVPLTALVNLLGDLVLVGPLGMGAAGAAWATVGSLYVNALSLTWLWRRKGREIPGMSKLFVGPSLKDVSRLVRFAAPLFVALAARVYMGLSLTLSAVTLGTAAIAANQVIECLYWMFCPFGEAISLCMQAYLPALLTKGGLFARKLQSTGFKAAIGLGAMAATTAALLPVTTPGLFSSSAPVVAQMASAAPMLGVGLFFYVVACASEGMLIARNQLRILAASHTLNTAALIFALRATVSRSGAGLRHVWAVLALCNLLRVGEFAFALRRAENDAAAAPGAIVKFLRKPRLALLRLKDRAVGVRRIEVLPNDLIDVPDIATMHPHLL